jgi:PleD family two-component response regulator
MPRQKYEGEIYIISSETTKEMLKAAEVVGVARVHNKMRDYEQINELCKRQGGKTVAVVDDTPISADALRRTLESHRVKEVVVYYNPLEAREEIPGHIPPFDTVFLDYRMPRMNGLELADKLRTGADI